MSFPVRFSEISNALYVSVDADTCEVKKLQIKIDQAFDRMIDQELSIAQLRNRDRLNSEEEVGLQLGLEALGFLFDELKGLSAIKEDLLLDLNLYRAMDEITKMDVLVSKFRSAEGQIYSMRLNNYLVDEENNYRLFNKKNFSIQQIQKKILKFSENYLTH